MTLAVTCAQLCAIVQLGVHFRNADIGRDHDIARNPLHRLAPPRYTFVTKPGKDAIMPRHIVARTSEIPPGGNKVVGIDGRDIVVFHVNGEFFALLNRCPHEGAPLDKAACVARLTSPEPGVYQRSRVGEFLRCAWHGWEFDMRTGQSWFDAKRFKIRSFPVAVERGEELAEDMKKGPYVAETFPVHVEDSYVIVET
jgi:3-phenylpropionate/trans-cinnamate dioxygenase ferredoxin subunit